MALAQATLVEPPQRLRWVPAGQKVRGAQHVRDSKPNQDDLRWQPIGERGVVLAVSDGHGSDHCFRSHTGAQLAVKVAVDLLAKVVSAKPGPPDEGTSVRVWNQLPLMLTSLWVAAVRRDLQERPFTVDEQALLRTVEGAAGGATDQQLLAYGATLLAVAATERYLMLLQIGDGEILLVADDSEEALSALPEDPTLIANETPSLCLPHAHECFRRRVLRLDGAVPRLVLLITDGYPNSFETGAGFRQVGRDLRDAIRRRGLDAVEADLARWLDEASREGSGDDCTLGLIWREDALPEEA